MSQRIGGKGWIRTIDPLVNSQSLCPLSYFALEFGLGERIRTSDFLLPKQALCQLSYTKSDDRERPLRFLSLMEGQFPDHPSRLP